MRKLLEFVFFLLCLTMFFVSCGNATWMGDE